MIKLVAANTDRQLYNYPPVEVKQAVVGYGKAPKRQVQEMVKLLLRLKEIPRPDHAADALAVAICHARSYKGYFNCAKGTSSHDCVRKGHLSGQWIKTGHR